MFMALLELKLNIDIMVGLQWAEARKKVKAAKGKGAQKSRVKRINQFVREINLKRLARDNSGKLLGKQRKGS